MLNEHWNRQVDSALSQIQFHGEVPKNVITRFEDVKSVLELAREDHRGGGLRQVARLLSETSSRLDRSSQAAKTIRGNRPQVS